MTSTAAHTPTPRGRRCDTCALSAETRERVEQQLALGRSFSHVSRIPGAPSRDSLRRHVVGRHLAPAIQEAIERAHGLDAVSVAGRIADAAGRAREAGLVALENGDAALALRAIDAEVRTLGVLAGMGVEREDDALFAEGVRDVAHAVFRMAHRGDEAAEAVAHELDRMHRPLLADDVIDQFPETRGLEA